MEKKIGQPLLLFMALEPAVLNTLLPDPVDDEVPAEVPVPAKKQNRTAVTVVTRLCP